MFRKSFIVVAVISLTFIFCQRTYAQLCSCEAACKNTISECDYCQCSQGISPLETGSTGIRFDVRSLYRSSLYNGSAKQPNPENIHETYQTDQLMGFYRIGETGLTASIFIPYVVRKSYHIPIITEESGISDVVTRLTYFYKDYIDASMVGVSLSGGIKFVTGNSDMILPSGMYVDPHIRPGTGTTDIILGAAGLWSLDRIGLTAAFTLGVVTGAGAADSGGMHKFGNYFLSELTGRFRILPSDISESNLSFTFGLGGEIHGKETLGSEIVTASGETLIYFAPGLKYIISTNFSVDASVQIPLYQNLGWDPLTGENQLGQNYRIVAGLQYLL